MKYSTILTAILTIFLFSCESTSKEENLTIKFQGITETSTMGIIKSSDNSDWKLDDNWTEIEKNLFELSFENVCSQEPDNVIGSGRILAYPNPCIRVLNLSFPSFDGKSISVRLVKSDFSVLLSKDSVSTNISIDCSSFGEKGEIIRLYYKILGESCEFRGHGDIEIK